MLLFLKKIWKYFSNIGIIDSLSAREKKRVMMLNQIMLATTFFDILSIIVYSFFPAIQWQDYFFIVFVFLSKLIVFLLHYKQNHYAARSYIVIAISLMMASLILFYGPNKGNEYGLVVTFIYVIISFENKFYRFAHYLYISALFLFTRFYYHNYGTIIDYNSNPELLEVVQGKADITFVICIGVMVFLTHWYINDIISLQKQTTNLLTEVNEKNKNLSQLNQEVERFAYITSHDLKTPLRTIVSFLGLIDRKIKNKEYDNLEEYLKFAQDGATKMHILITDILEYAQLSNSESNTNPINLNDILAQVSQQLGIRQSDAANKSVVKVGDLPVILANEAKMKVLFQNLIENGLKYNDSAKAMVSVQANQLDNNLILEFKDNGIGIEPEYRTQIFEMFKRLHNNEAYQGTGIGLSVCKKIVDAMGGSINVAANVDGGSVFRVVLPVV